MYSRFIFKTTLFAACLSCNNVQTKLTNAKDSVQPIVSAHTMQDPVPPTIWTGTSYKNPNIWQSDTAIIANKRFVLTVYKKLPDCYFIIQKLTHGKLGTIMKEPDFGTNRSDISFEDANNDGYPDIVWDGAWHDRTYLYNPTTENFVEVGELGKLDTLKAGNVPVMYRNKYPLLYYCGYEKPRGVVKCTGDTTITETRSDLFIINDDYQKLIFASIDNFQTFDDPYMDTITCGAQIIKCYNFPFPDEVNLIKDGIAAIDSFYLPANNKFFSDNAYAMDSAFINNYWLKKYPSLLKYGQLFEQDREKPIKYYK